MDCRTCEPTLIDLVHDELATDAAAEARAHLGECASCRASFERLIAAQRLSSELELAAAPQPVAARLLQLAEARASEVRAAAAQATAAPGFGRRVLDFVARFAMGRQVGMATIMLLIVAVGLWSLPRLRREPETAGTVVGADGEAAPTPGLEPASPLDLKVDPRSGRIRSKDEAQQLAQAHAAQAADEAAAAAGGAAEPRKVGLEEAEAEQDPLGRLDDPDDILGGKQDAPGEGLAVVEGRRDLEAEPTAEAPAAPVARASGGLGSTSSERDATRSGGAGPRPFPASSDRPLDDMLSGGLDLRPSAEAEGAATAKAKLAEAESTRARAAASASASASPAPPSARRAPEAPMPSPYMSGSTPASAASPAPSPATTAAARPTSTSSRSLLDAARRVARERGCQAAMPSFQRVVSAAPGTTDAGTAMIEMALCKRSLGLLADADRLLERAAGIPGTASRARSLLASPAKPAIR